MKKFLSFVLAFALMFAVTSPALAAQDSFTESVTAKQAPEIVYVDADKDVAALIKNDTTGETVEVPGGYIAITPVSDSGNAPTEAIKESLDTTYRQILAVGSLGDLSPDLQTAVQEKDSSVGVEDLVVRDLIDVSLLGSMAGYLDDDTSYLEITFNLGISANSLVWVMQTHDGAWRVVDNNNVTNNGDGTVTVRFYDLCPVAFLTLASASSNGGVTSPQTGYDNYTTLFITLAIISGIFAVTCFGLGMRKHNSSKKISK